MRIRGKDRVDGLLARAGPLLVREADLAASAGPLIPADAAPVRHLEIGCGRGAFLAELSARRPGEWFLGVDKYTPIVARAAALACERGLANVRFFDGDAERLDKWLPDGAFTRIFLNFSDPWPRRRNEKKRLTNARLLSLYERWLTGGGALEFKTDSEPLFDWSARELARAGWRIEDAARGLPAPPPPGREDEPAFIQTEYEQKFRAQHLPILHLRARPPS